MYNGAVYFHIAMSYLLPKYWWVTRFTARRDYLSINSIAL